MLAIPLSLILGISAALYRNSYYDRSATGVSLVTVSSPEFFTAYIFILLLATLFPMFPTISTVNMILKFSMDLFSEIDLSKFLFFISMIFGTFLHALSSRGVKKNCPSIICFFSRVLRFLKWLPRFFLRSRPKAEAEKRHVGDYFRND